MGGLDRPSSGIENPEKRMKEVFMSVLEQRLREQPEGKTEPERIASLIEGTEASFRDMFPEFDIGPMYDGIKKEDWSGREAELADRVTQNVCELLLSRYSPREIEDMVRARTLEKNNWKAASDLVLYEVSDSHIVLHVPITFSRSVLEVGSSFQEGLRELANRLMSEETLAPVERITGRSAIVFDYRKSLIRAGWTISEVEPESRLAMAEMSKDRFIEEYGPKEK